MNNDGGLLQVYDNSDNNKDKVYLLLIPIKLVSHMLNYVIVTPMTTVLQLSSSLM